MTSNNSPENLFVKSSLPETPAGAVQTAGDMLRQAREARGIDLATLSGMLKVSEAKLRALENNDFKHLPEMAFTRGFAKLVCKRLGIDEKPVLDLLPDLHSSKPSDFAVDLTRPALPSAMREGFRRSRRGGLWWWLLGALVLVLLFLFLMPDEWKNTLYSSDVEASSDEQGQSSETTGAPVPAATPMGMTGMTTLNATDPAAQNGPQDLSPDGEVLDAQPMAADGDAAQPAGDVAPEDVAVTPPVPEELSFSVQGGSSSITVKGNDGSVVMTRVLRDGEEAKVPLDKLPLKVNVGNVKVTKVKLRDQAFELMPHTKRNTANFEVN